MRMRLFMMASAMAGESCGKLGVGRGKFLLWEAALDMQSNTINNDGFLDAVRQCIDEDSLSEVLDLVSNEQFKGLIEFVGWEIIGVILPNLNIMPLKKDFIKILERVSEVCNPKEIILGFTENLDAISSIQCLQICLINLQRAIMKMNWKRAKLVKMCCEDVSKRLRGLSQSTFAECSKEDQKAEFQQHKYENKEDYDHQDVSQLGLEVEIKENGHLPSREKCKQEDGLLSEKPIYDEMVQKRICCMADAGLSFVNPFTNATLTAGCYFHKEDVTLIATNFLCNLLVNPLSWYEISGPTKEDDVALLRQCLYCNDESRSISSRILEAFFSLKIPFVEFMKFDQKIGDVTLENDSKAMLSYLMLVKDIGSKYYPFVLSPLFLFEINLKSLLQFLKRSDFQGRKKSLELAEDIMMRIPEAILSAENENSRIFQNLIEIMVSDCRKELRNYSLKIFTFSIEKFDTGSRLDILRGLLLNVTHSGACGLIIQFIKNEALKAGTKENTTENCSDSKFLELMYLSLNPVMQEGCDVLMQSERITVALNLLRFLLLRSSQNEDQFGILANFSKIEDAYLSPLRDKVHASFAEHLSLLTETEREPSANGRAMESNYVGDTVSSVNHFSLSLQEIRFSLNTLDIIKSLLARISQLQNDLLSS